MPRLLTEEEFLDVIHGIPSFTPLRPMKEFVITQEPQLSGDNEFMTTVCSIPSVTAQLPPPSFITDTKLSDALLRIQRLEDEVARLRKVVEANNGSSAP